MKEEYNKPEKLEMSENVKNEKLNLTIEIVNERDWEDYKKIWLEAMEKEPLAYWITEDNKKSTSQKTEKEWREELNDSNSVIFLSKNNNIPIGMAQVLLKNEEYRIRRVYLNEDFRGSGFGEKMVILALDEIKKRGGKKVVLNVVDTQGAAKKMYEKLGFKVSGLFESENINGIEYPSGQFMEKEI